MACRGSGVRVSYPPPSDTRRTPGRRGARAPRNVRAPSGRVQDNVLSGQLEGKCHRNIPPQLPQGTAVRVKSCCKSARRSAETRARVNPTRSKTARYVREDAAGPAVRAYVAARSFVRAAPER